MLEPWIKTCSTASWNLRTYADVSAAGGSVPDFFASNGLSLTQGRTARSRANKGLHRALMEIALRGNIELADPLRTSLFQNLLKIGPSLSLPDGKDIEMYGTKKRSRLHTRYMPIHTYLSDFTGRPFFDDIDDLLTTRPVPESSVSADALKQICENLGTSFPVELQDWLGNLDLSKSNPPH